MTSPSNFGPFQPATQPVPPPPPLNGMANVVESAPPVYVEELPVYLEEPPEPEDAEFVLPSSDQTEEPPVKRKKKKKKHHRIDPDSLPVLITAVSLVFILIAASFLASFAAIYEVALYTGVSQDWRWVFPVFIDAAITAYTISLFVFRANKRSIKLTLVGLSFFALLSVLANIAHVLAYWNGELPDYRAWIGVALAAAAPIGVLMASEEIARLAFVDDADEDDDYDDD